MALDVLSFGAGWGRALALGLGVTLSMAGLTSALGSAIGLAAALILRSRHFRAAAMVNAALSLLRSLPEVLIIFAVYYGASVILGWLMLPFGGSGFVTLNAFVAGLCAMSLIHAAYAAEIFRGALHALPSGLGEAAASLGLRKWQRFRLIELPLALRHALPGLVNLTIVALKITPFLAAIGLQDLLRTASDAARNTKDYLTFYVAALIIYLIVAGLLYLLQLQLQRGLEGANRT